VNNRAVVLSRSVSELDLVWLAAISMNASPVHFDAARAALGPMGAPIVVGALTAAIAEGLASHVVPLDLGVPIGWESITLAAPVYVRDEIRVETKLLAPLSSDKDAHRRVQTRAFVGNHKLVAELVTLYGAEQSGD
jgi:acyl dehydratase